ncbi:MAG: DNA-binding response regulator [Litorilinea sp.]|nr:MAG: DNA-binding response regulator [Litorilinea sp.]
MLIKCGKCDTIQPVCGGTGFCLFRLWLARPGIHRNMTEAMHLRILLVDDHEVVRIGLKTLLSAYPEFEVVAEAADAQEAVEKALYVQPDVVIMDVRLPGKSGIEATREILARRPETRVIMLTSYAEDEMLFDAIAAGAAGYVLKQIGSDDLVRALKTVARGESLLDPAVTQKVFEQVRTNARRAEEEAFASLTDQELVILSLITRGLTNKEIARQVFLSEKTVRNYVSSILSKLNLSSRAEAAAYAVRHHIENHVPSSR